MSRTKTGYNYVGMAILTVIAACASPQRDQNNPLSIPLLPERYRNGHVDEYYPDASQRAHEVGETVAEFSVKENGQIESVSVREQQSAPYPRLIEATYKLLKGLKLEMTPSSKRTLSISFIFEITPSCGTITHSVAADYNVNLCATPRPPAAPFVIPEFVQPWNEAFKTSLDHQRLIELQKQMTRFERTLHLPPLKHSGHGELRVWINHGDSLPVTAVGLIIRGHSLQHCTFPFDAKDHFVRPHCVASEGHDNRLYWETLKELEPYTGMTIYCASHSALNAIDAEMDIEWIDKGKRFTIHSNDTRQNLCFDSISSQLNKLIEAASEPAVQ